jgi:VWFA-related protein
MARSLIKLIKPINGMSLALSAAAMLTGLSVVAQNPATDGPTTTLRADARLVVLDVMVTDAQGHAVSGLKLDDFKLRENGAEQTLKSLEDHTAIEPAKPPPSPAFLPAVMPVGMYANRPKVEGNVWNVLVLDMLNTAMPDEARTRQQMRQFAKTLPPGVPVALVRLSASSPTIMVPFRGRNGH